MKTVIAADPPVNQAPADLDPSRNLPRGFYEFLTPLHRAFTPRQQELAARRRTVLEAAHGGKLPDYLGRSEATTGSWKVSLPGWCQDQRNQMTGPGDDGELVVKMLNSGAPGVMLDLEDSVANAWPNIMKAIENIIAALRGELTYQDKKRNREVSINDSKTVIYTRPRGLHLEQGGVIKGERMAAALFDVAMVAYQVDPTKLKHPLSIYIPKSESADEALWWRDLFVAIADARGWPQDYIRCMALVEAHPLAYQMEEFAYNLREHIMGLNLGRWDYMASLIDFTLHDPAWVLPDRNTIPHDVAFFQAVREVMPEVCHKRGMLAIGGMSDSMREAQGYLMPVLLAILMPITFLMQAIIAGTGGVMVEILTWVPLWTPFAVLARLGVGIPTWEVIGSGLVLAAFTALSLIMVGRLFRASLLAQGQRPNLREVIARMRSNGETAPTGR